MRFYETEAQQGSLVQPLQQMHLIQSIRNEDLDKYPSLCTIRLGRDHQVVEEVQCPPKSHVFRNQEQWDSEITEANTTIFAEKENNYCFII